ncbi:MAG TPA: adenylate/guanylate cyclase domain-containing protein [Solirubrobacteraceae bacterium]|jgi:class 3 adenylate cyclase
MTPPRVQYARSADAYLAFQVVGAEPVDLLFIPPVFTANLDVLWRHPLQAAAFHNIAAFARLILYDRRGSGLSDAVFGPTTLEQHMDDALAVMDAVGSERAALLVASLGAELGCMLAATYPERFSALVLWAPLITKTTDPTRAAHAFQPMVQGWGTGAQIDRSAPSAAEDDGFRRWYAELERGTASPSAFTTLLKCVWQTDIRPVLPTIRQPTVVIHNKCDRTVSIRHGRETARLIPNARLVEIPGQDHFPWVDQRASAVILDETARLITGAPRAAQPDRALATLVFTDIAGSTQRAAEMGDERWRMLLDEHHRLTSGIVRSFRGRFIKSLGDGALMSFDGPARAVRAAHAVVMAVDALGLRLRAGVHTGECEMLADGDIGGIAVHIGARVADLAPPGHVLVSSTVRDLVVGSGIEFVDRGLHELKGVPDQWQLLAVENA